MSLQSPAEQPLKSRTNRGFGRMADAGKVGPVSTNGRKTRPQDPAKVHNPVDTNGKDLEEKHPESTRSNGSKVENVQTAAEEEKPKPSKVKEILGKLDLDIGTVIMMFK